MSSNNQPSGPRTDGAGTIYWTPASGPAPSETQIKIQTDKGLVPGTLVGGMAIKDKP